MVFLLSPKSGFMKKFSHDLIWQIIFFFPVLFPVTLISPLNAQVSCVEGNPEVKVEVDSIHRKVNVEFSADKPIYNLLVLMTDSSGNTVFLDNQYQFKGKYRHNIDFAPGKKEKYFLQIIRDNDRFIKEIIIHQD